uniref:PDZK1-interacting protein 1 n=1 Tax=Suricata suricatta TaxID=37032 RepID=A0A673UFK3_SURSU
MPTPCPGPEQRQYRTGSSRCQPGPLSSHCSRLLAAGEMGGLGSLQPWMQGLIAVAVFLVLVAIAFAVNRFWCQEEPEPVNMVMTVGNKADGILVGTDGRYSSMAASFRSNEHENAYENVPEEEGRVRSTPM